MVKMIIRKHNGTEDTEEGKNKRTHPRRRILIRADALPEGIKGNTSADPAMESGTGVGAAADSADEEDIFAAAINSEINARRFGGEEPIIFTPIPYDPINKIATLLEKERIRYPAADMKYPLDAGIVLSYLARSTPPSAFEGALNGRGKIALEELSGMVLSAEALKGRGISVPVNKSLKANDYMRDLGEKFSERMERILSIKIDEKKDQEKGHEANQKKLPERKAAAEHKEGEGHREDKKEEYQNIIFPGFRTETIITANAIYKKLEGLEERVKTAGSIEELAKLTAINICAELVPEDERIILKQRANDATQELDSLLTRALAGVAMQNGLAKKLTGISLDEALTRYDQMLKSRAGYVRFLREQLAEFRGIAIDYQRVVDGIAANLKEKRGILFRVPKISNKEEYAEFRKELMTFSIKLYERAQLENKTDKINEKYKAVFADNEKARQAALEKAADTMEFIKYSKELTQNLLRIIKGDAGLERIIADSPVGFKKFNDYHKNLRNIIEQHYAQIIADNGKDMKIRLGDLIEVVDALGFSPEKERKEKNYYYGGDTEEIPLKTKGEVIGLGAGGGIIANLKVKGADVTWELCLGEIKATGENTYADKIIMLGGTPAKIAENILEQAEGGLFEKYLVKAKEKINRQFDQKKKNIAERNAEEIRKADAHNFKEGDAFIIAKCLGKGGYYKLRGSLKEADAPIGTIGKITEYYDDGFWHVRIPDIRGLEVQGKLHHDEIEKLKLVSPKLAVRAGKGAKAIVVDGSSYNFTKEGSWGYILGETENKYKIEFHHLTGGDRTPATYDISKKNVKIMPADTKKIQKELAELDRKTNGLVTELEGIVNHSEKEMDYAKDRKQKVVESGVTTLRAMGVDEAMIRAFFENELDDVEEYVKQGLISDNSIFGEIKGMKQLIESGGFEKIQSYLFQKEGLFIYQNPKSKTTAETQKDLTKNISEKLMNLEIDVFRVVPHRNNARIAEGDFTITVNAKEGKEYSEGTSIEKLPLLTLGRLSDLYENRARFRLASNVENYTLEQKELQKLKPIKWVEDPKRCFMKGTRVAIKTDSGHWGQSYSIGTMRQEITNVTESGGVDFDSDYRNSYRPGEDLIIISLGTDAIKSLNGRNKQKYEEEKRKLVRAFKGAIKIMEENQPRIMQQINERYNSMISTLQSFGFRNEEINSLVEKQGGTGEAEYLAENNMI